MRNESVLSKSLREREPIVPLIWCATIWCQRERL